MTADRVRVRVDGRELVLSNLDKVLYPAAGFTKGEVINYYTRVAPALLPHLDGRPLTTIRFPDGVDRPGFFEKNVPAGAPAWIRRHAPPAPGPAYVLADGVPALVWLANLAAVELHVPQWRVGASGPDRLVLDLDPGPPAGLPQCARLAVALRERLASDGLTAYPKLSGRKGMQLLCPISGEQPARQVSGYARRIAEEFARAWPDLVVSRMTRSLRTGRVLIDWSQNNAAKTTIAPYSLRAEPEPSVSAPLTWAEVGAGTPGGRRALRPVRPEQVLARIDRHGDLMGELDHGPRVPDA